MWQAGLIEVVAGNTTMDELKRVVEEDESTPESEQTQNLELKQE
jgi:hypothetical protein